MSKSMLRNLVKKFKSHSLNEEAEETNSSTVTKWTIESNLRIARNHLRSSGHGPTAMVPQYGPMAPSSVDKDSGTESDEELAKTETNSAYSVPVSQTSDYYASQQSLSASCRSSHCGSPILGGFSDQDCNSWDSIGCESGIGLRVSEANDAEMQSPPELPNHHYHTRQQFQRFLKQQMQISKKNGLQPINQQAALPCIVPEDDSDRRSIADFDYVRTAQNHESIGCSMLYSRRAATFPPGQTSPTAFLDVRKGKVAMGKISSPGALSGSSIEELDEYYGASECTKLKVEPESETNEISRGRSSIPASCSASEKRKWSQVRSSSSSSKFVSGSDSANQVDKNTGVMNTTKSEPNTVAEQRQLLTAARKTPIKVVIPLRDDVASQNANQWAPNPLISACPCDTKFSPRKKCRRAIDPGCDEEDLCNSRPSLNFDKMREGWTPGYQLRSSRIDAPFQSVDANNLYSATTQNFDATNLNNSTSFSETK